MTVRINHGQIARDKARLGERWGDRVGRRVQNAARRRAPVDSGALRNSIEYVVDVGPNSTRVTIGSALPYARYLHEGTGIYGPQGTPIVPVTREVLKFQVKGSSGRRRGRDAPWVFAKSVKGVKPNPFLVDALVEVMGRVDRLR
ncbi:tail completion or Neck1 protein [Gordonia phage MelBins]|uniref:Tail assembly chaperone n=2 Tax=Leonardvirus TaxID=2948800 RepID=A0A649VPJ7_9CAUD|nr:tail completion or Neck1 protein [Gordonia phage MelBins]YP_010002503.1 tail completion or Neck1 protein [Gordonia phage Ali17]AXQ60642.1 hypothetical protein SEA_ALI17_26 [Gordonia phage Ali17]QGJ93583.1 hypothetical protein SEA_MELBINS_29 [Gordonia phage MelBins]